MDSFGLAQDLTDPKWLDQEYITANRPHILEVIENFYANMDVEELYRGAQGRGFAAGPINTPEDALADPHWHDRGFFAEVAHPEIGRSVTYPGSGTIYNESPWSISRRAPHLGEHNAEVLEELGLSQTRVPTPA